MKSGKPYPSAAPPPVYHDFPLRRFCHLLHKKGAVLLETSACDSKNYRSYVFTDPIEIIPIFTPEEVPHLLARIDAHLDERRWVAGYLGYECGYHFEEVAPLSQSETPIAWFGIYVQPLIFDHRTGKFAIEPDAPLQQDGDIRLDYTLHDFRVALSPEEYANAVGRIRDHLHAGNTYQINLTTKYNFEFGGSPFGLYEDLRAKQRVPYGAFINCGTRHILSHSPELFFTLQDNLITTKPMKGTAQRGRTLEEDRLQQQWLKNDAKSRAENVMIVDLLRNDLGRICETGSVTVQDLFSVERYTTLHQMTSSVTGTLRQGVSTYDLLKSIFPSGSVTGAPKIRSMKIIHELESGPRGVYTGAIGFFSPDGTAAFNVAIRTLVLEGTLGEMGVGSGIVADSVTENEYEECRLKARFLTEPARHFDMLETIGWHDGYLFLEEHLMRLQNSAAYFDFPCPLDQIRNRLMSETEEFQPGATYKVRLLLTTSGVVKIESRIVEVATPAVLPIGLSPGRTDSRDVFLYHKTTNRELYDEMSRMAGQLGVADILFLNERNEVTEGAVSNVFIKRGGAFLTPPVRCGLLPGIYRQHLLETLSGASEAVLTVGDLREADAVYICNSVRGIQQVRLQIHSQTEAALSL